MRVSKVKRKNEIDDALGKIFKDVENLRTASLDTTITGKKGRSSYIVFYVPGTDSVPAQDVGILKGDIVIIDTTIQETEDRNGIICSVVLNDTVFDPYIEFEAEDSFGNADILDCEFLYTDDPDSKPKRKKKGDNPQLKRVIIGVVVGVFRGAANLRPIVNGSYQVCDCAEIETRRQF